MNISWQKSDCKNLIQSVDKGINFTFSSNSLFWPPSKNWSCFGTSPLIKFLLALEWVIHLFLDHLFDQDTHHHHHPLPLEKAFKWRSPLSRSCFSFFGTVSIILFALSIRFVIGRSKCVFRASTVGVCGGKKGSSKSFSISGLYTGKGSEGGMPGNKGVLRSLYLPNNFSSLLSNA